MGFLMLCSGFEKKCYVHILIRVIKAVAILYCWDRNNVDPGMNMDMFPATITFCCDKQTVT